MTEEERLKKEIASLQRHLEKSRALEKTPVLLGEESVKNLLREALGEIDRWRECAEKLAGALKIHHQMPGYSEALAQYKEMKAGEQ